MSPTKQQQREDTIRALTATARALFAEHGYAHVGLDTITQATGVSKGALYHHFSSKADLFRAVLAQIQHEVGARVAQAADAEPEPWDQLLAGCHAFLATSSDPEIQRILLLDGPSVLGWHEWRALDEANSARHLTEALQSLIDNGTLRAQPVEPLVHLLSGAMNEAALWLAEAPDNLPDTMAALTRLLESLRA